MPPIHARIAVDPQHYLSLSLQIARFRRHPSLLLHIKLFSLIAVLAHKLDQIWVTACSGLMPAKPVFSRSKQGTWQRQIVSTAHARAGTHVRTRLARARRARRSLMHANQVGLIRPSAHSHRHTAGCYKSVFSTVAFLFVFDNYCSSMT